MSCAVISCNNYKSRRRDGISFHRFPKDGELLKKWTKSLGLPNNWSWSSNKLVCSNHFNDTDFKTHKLEQGRKFLKNTAIPTLSIFNKNYQIDVKLPQENKKPPEILLEEFENSPVENLKRPLGEKYLRVCRICMEIQKKENTTPLFMRGSLRIRELYNKLRNFLQMELYPVDDSCLCKNCENFINNMFNFISTCKNNEKTLTEFDWTNKTKNLLHIVNQEKLVSLLSDIKGKEIEESHEIPEQFDETTELEENGNSLSDMEDHWYYADENEEKSYEFPRKYPENSWNYTFQIPTEDDLFSPAFDKYFNTVGDQASVRLMTKCKKYNLCLYGDPPYLCEICGEVKQSKCSLTKHIKKCSLKKLKRCPKNEINIVSNFGKYAKIKQQRDRRKLRFFSCDKCSRKYPKIGSVILHKKQCHKDAILEANSSKNTTDDQDLVLENYDFFIDDKGNPKIVILENDEKFFKEFQNGIISLE